MSPFAKLVLVLTVAAVTACGGDEDGPKCTVSEPWPSVARESADPLALLRCDVVPHLCDLEVVSDVADEDLVRAIDLVFIPDGFRANELNLFHAHVDVLVANATADPGGILGRDRALFNVHRVEVAATTDAYPLGTCRQESTLNADTLLASDPDRVARAAANAPDADAVIVVSRGVDGIATAPAPDSRPAIVNLGGTHDHRVLTHELGHALFDLGDEYVASAKSHPLSDLRWRRSRNRFRPNVSFSPDEGWDDLAIGGHQGAMQYARGVYRPTNSCRMLDEQRFDAFCPVCSAHIDSYLLARRTPGNGPPTCGFLFSRADDSGRPCPPTDGECGLDGRATLHIIAWDGDGIDSIELLHGGRALPAVLCFSPSGCRRRSLIETDFDIRLLEGASQIGVRCTDNAGEVGESALAL